MISHQRVFIFLPKCLLALSKMLFPIFFVIDGASIKRLLPSPNKGHRSVRCHCPMSFGTTDIKTLNRVWLRALMYNTTSMSVAAFNSLDGVNFFPIKGLIFGQRDGNFLDVDLGLLSRVTYKSYMLILAGTVDEETQFRYSEYEVDKRYNNDKNEVVTLYATDMTVATKQVSRYLHRQRLNYTII